jgi:hypothetical protein
MKKHPEVDLSFHPATMTYVDKSRPDKILGKHRKKTEVIPLGEVIRGGGGFCATNSLIIKREVLDNLPNWFYKEAPVGDVFIQIYGAKKGGALFLSRNMSNYRGSVKGSWSDSMQIYENSILIGEKLIICLEKMKKTFSQDNGKDFNLRLSTEHINLATLFLINKTYSKFQRNIKKSWQYYPQITRKQELFYVARNIPFVLNIILRLKRVL